MGTEHAIWLIILFLLDGLWAQDGCSEAPPALRSSCERLARIDETSRKQIDESGVQPGASCSIPDELLSTNVCMDLGCLCREFGGEKTGKQCRLPSGQLLKKALRKEYRALSMNERRRFHNAMLSIKNNGEFNKLAYIHHAYAGNSSAHSGPGFLPWHREFLKRMEFALRRVDPSVALPYWDSAMDYYLEDPRDSIIWTDEFMGNTHGAVSSGPFAGWKTIDNTTLVRNVTAYVGGRPLSELDVQLFFSFTDIAHVLGLTGPREMKWNKHCPIYSTNYMEVEFTHGMVHNYIGGHMGELDSSANEPIFYLLHSFVDMMWEVWRLDNQDRETREYAYPEDDSGNCYNLYHTLDSDMTHLKFDYPDITCSSSDFLATTRTGLSNHYTDNLYGYAPRPSCPSCANSDYLFCSERSLRCVSKIKPGGNCQGFENEPACYGGNCVNGRCVSVGDYD